MVVCDDHASDPMQEYMIHHIWCLVASLEEIVFWWPHWTSLDYLCLTKYKQSYCNVHCISKLSCAVWACWEAGLSCPLPHSHFTAKHVCLKVSSKTSCLGIGMSCPTPTMLQRRKRTAKQPESSKAVSLKTTRKQTISNRGCYCLSHDVRVFRGTRSWSSAVWSLSMERKLSWKLQLTASTFPIDFCCMFGTSWFDGVTSVCSLNQATPSMLWAPDLAMLCSLSVVSISYLLFVPCILLVIYFFKTQSTSVDGHHSPDGSGHMGSALPWECFQSQRIHCTGLSLFLPGLSAMFQV